jgi:cytochrome P450
VVQLFHLSRQDHPTQQIDRNRFVADPYAELTRLRELGPVHRVSRGDGRSEVWWIVGYEEARRAFSDRRLTVDFATTMETLERDGRADAHLPSDATGPFNRDLLSVEPPDHTRLRDVVRRRFSTRAVEDVRPRARAVAEELIDGIAPRGEADLVADFAFELSLRVICEVMGLPVDQARPAITMPDCELDRDGEIELLHRSFRFISRAIRRTRPHVDVEAADEAQPDVLHLLIAARAQDRLSEEELVDLSEMLFSAGARGASAAIAHGLAALLTRPDQLELLRDRLELVPSAVEEMLRIEGTEEFSRNRVAAEDIEIGGTVIPKGGQVVIFDSAADRDPARFPDPERLDITRDPNRHIAFGHGIHFCLGAPLSRIELQEALGAIVRRLPELRLACAPEDLRWIRSPHVHGRLLVELPVRFAS